MLFILLEQTSLTIKLWWYFSRSTIHYINKKPRVPFGSLYSVCASLGLQSAIKTSGADARGTLPNQNKSETGLIEFTLLQLHYEVVEIHEQKLYIKQFETEGLHTRSLVKEKENQIPVQT